jgi:hypothetical protein
MRSSRRNIANVAALREMLCDHCEPLLDGDHLVALITELQHTGNSLRPIRRQFTARGVLVHGCDSAHRVGSGFNLRKREFERPPPSHRRNAETLSLFARQASISPTRRRI